MNDIPIVDPEEASRVRYIGKSYTAKTILAILVTWCCCIPLGLFALVYSTRAWTLSLLGRPEEARDHERKSTRFLIAGTIIGIIITAAVITYYVHLYHTFMAMKGSNGDQSRDESSGVHWPNDNMKGNMPG